jgi:two-component system, OmpR family, phosphate regulon response regulator PhoB
MLARILIVETEAPLARLMRRNLEGAGYQVDAVARDADADICLRESAPDLVVLDAPPPDTSGDDLCTRVRSYADKVPMPIIALVSHDADGLRGLDAGADDFIVKPLSAPHLLARVRALLRRARPTHAGPILRVADVELDRECHRATRANRDLHLGPTEFRLLEFLMRSPERVFSREELLAGIWGQTNIDVRTIDVHIGRLRSALNIGNRPDPVRTVRGAGYAFKQEP